jgi:CO/xanthine dehydrogenase Mo-binding subunit/aerobic-type carbon monoxide dehydrogenase small subunit (CoxS/CutS family)
MKIQFKLNGILQKVETDPGRPLLDLLRNEFGLTGTKQGCDHEGECGTCTVLLNGKAIRSCLTPAGKIQDQEILTIEGLGSPDHPHPLQTAFAINGAVQCGFCTPGMLLSAKALLDQNPAPSQNQIKEALAGNLCRCTGYQRIIEAVQLASSWVNELPEISLDMYLRDEQIIGGSALRENIRQFVSGETRYAGDFQIPDLHHLFIYRSPYHHAKLVSLDTSHAKRVPGVVQVITADDIPGDNGLGDYSRDEPVLVKIGGSCKIMGTPIAIIVAESISSGHAGLEAISSDFEELPAVFSISSALDETSPRIYKTGNHLTTADVKWGNLSQAFNESELIIDRQYRTSWQEHAALEPETLIGYLDEEERITVIGGTHEPHWQQRYIANCLNLSESEVRVIMPPTGGSFGGKQDPWPFIATALGLFFTRKPVRLQYTRAESFLASPKRHPYQINLKVGINKKNQLTGIQTRIQANTGGYDGHGQYIVDFALVGSGGPYQFQAVDGKADSIYTNGPKAGQFRGFGTPQSTFALECLLDEISQQMDLDPLNLRLQNCLKQESTSFMGYPIGESIGFQQVLETIQPSYQQYLEEVEGFNSQGKSNHPYQKGVGLAGMWYRFGKSGSLVVEAKAEIGKDGKLIIYCSAPDYGQGSSTVMSQVAAEALELPRDMVKVINADTLLTPDSGIQGASRATYFVGGAVLTAAKKLKNALITTAAESLDCSPHDLQLSEDGIHCVSRSAVISYQELADELYRHNQPTCFQGLFDLSDNFPPESSPEFIPLFVTGAQVVEVLVNMKTGEVTVPRITAVHDVGKVINPQEAKGQVEGAILMGLGTALMEEYLPGITKGFGDYYLPTAMSTPDIKTIFIEIPSFQGPFGVKGLGEAAILPTAPAIINGISRVIGKRIFSLPATPEVVLSNIPLTWND